MASYRKYGAYSLIISLEVVYLIFENVNFRFLNSISHNSEGAKLSRYNNLLVTKTIVKFQIVSWLLWLGKIGITVGMGVTTWWYYNYTSTKYEMEFWWVPVIFVVIGSYLVANVFFSVYEVAVDTIFLCFLEDCERNDGSRYKPYYMSHQLRKLLHK